jgi:hypothetical protein
VDFLLQALLLVALAAAGVALLYGIYWAISRDAVRDKSRDPMEITWEALNKGVDSAVAKGCTVGRLLLLVAIGFIVYAALSLWSAR